MNKQHYSILVLATSFVISGMLVANAQTNTGGIAIAPVVNPANITYPIPELGNCTDQNNCKTYCNVVANMPACLDYAKAHNLMKSDDVERARKMANLAKTGGPGGCKNQNECETYCENTDHLNECVAFAEKENLVPREALQEMQRINKVLRGGGQLPGGCKSKNECEAFCSNSANMEQCVAFAEKSGMLSGKELEDAKRVMPFIAKGETPGACKTKADCEKYCADSSHAMECVAFAEKAGFISKEDADMARKTGGKGPGGCTSKESCDAFCNAKENQDSCFAFAKQHGLIKPEELQSIKEGMSRLRMGMGQFPGEVVQCLKDKLGADAVGKIESGQMAPNKELGDIIKNCFEAFKPKMKAKIEEGLKYATPEVTACLNSALTPDELQKMKEGSIDSPEKGDKVKTCFEQMRGAAQGQIQKGVGQLNQLPEEARNCVKEKLGSDLFGKLQSTDPETLKGINQTDIQSAVASCMSQFRPKGLPEGATLPPGIKGAPSPEQIKQMMEQGLRSGQVPGNIQPTRPQNGPTPEQIKEMMRNGLEGDQPASGFPINIPGGPTPEQIKEMMRQQIPQGFPQPPQQ